MGLKILKKKESHMIPGVSDEELYLPNYWCGLKYTLQEGI